MKGGSLMGRAKKKNASKRGRQKYSRIGEPLFEEQIRLATLKWEKILKPMSEAIRRSEQFTTDDYAVTVTI